MTLIRFADYTLDTSSEELTRAGIRVSLQPQPMKVLILLASRPGELVSRADLQHAVWGADTFVDFDQGLNWCIRRIREVLGDDATHPRFIETKPRKGYRFIAPILTDALPAPVVGRTREPHRWVAVVTVALLCLAGTGAGRALSADRAVTVVVLPFDNLTGDLRNNVVADATTEEIINQVGGIDPARIKVVDRLTAMKFRRTNECIIHIGRQLGAQYVVEGSVQSRHVTAALYRVDDNTQLWATAIRGNGEAGSLEISRRIGDTFIER